VEKLAFAEPIKMIKYMNMRKLGKNFGVCFALLAMFLGFFDLAASPALASETSGTIDSTNKYAWANNIGWINFKTDNGNVSITDSGITGYIWNENYGWINMDPTQSGVSVSAAGALSGNAWGEGTGWINFSGVSIDCSGNFSGSATGDIVGTVTFDCTNCAVSTDYRPQNCRSGGGGGGGPEVSWAHNVCNNATHTCQNVTGSGPNECQVVGALCCDPHGDLDWSGAINLTDFSILLYNWDQTPPLLPDYLPCADINKDGTVDLADFSIMLYWWTGWNKFLNF